MRLVNVTPPSWMETQRPGIDSTISPDVLRAMKAALRAVDIDIERTGAVSPETVEKVRAVRAKLEE